MKKAALKRKENQSKVRSVLNPLSLLAYLMFVIVTLCTFLWAQKSRANVYDFSTANCYDFGLNLFILFI